jgi:hypothetical protein
MLRPRLLELRDDPQFPIGRIRLYDFEEDADDAAVRVLRALGYPPTGNGEFLLRLMRPEDAGPQCARDVEAQLPIRYGNLADPHPANCWRYYHATQLAEALGACDG